jgi:hypothetical protein
MSSVPAGTPPKAALPRSPFLKTYVIAVLALGLGAYAYLVESRREIKPDKAREKVLAFEKGKVLSVTLTPAEGENVRLAREGEAWRLTAPIAAPADAAEVDSLLSSLESLEMEEEVAASAANLADYGLEAPKQGVSLMLEGGGDPLKLLLGSKTPDGGALYAQLAQRPRVFTIPAHLESTLGKQAFELRDRDLLHVKRDAVKTLEVTGPEGSYALARDDKGEWAFTKPVATRAGRWSVDGLLGTIEGLRMEKVAAEEATGLKPFGLEPPSRRVVLGLADGTTKTLEIGSSPEDKKHHAREATSRLVAVIPSALVDDLAKGMGELRAKRLLEVATYDVEGFDVEADGAKQVYAKASSKDKDGVENAKWTRSAPDAKELETSKVQDALFQIGSVEAREFVDRPAGLESYGFDKPALKVTLRYSGGKPAAWFELGQKDGATWARRVGDDAVLGLDPAKAAELIKAFKEL